MSLDGLPQQFAEFVERASAALSREVTAAKNIAAAAKAETASAQAALSNLQAQTKSTQDQLAAVTNDLQRLSDLVGIGHNIVKARAELKRVEAESAKAAKTLEARLKQISEADSRLVGLNLEANRMIAIRTEGEAVMAKLRSQLAQVPLGR
jgi:chromosome segregation ATPase